MPDQPPPSSLRPADAAEIEQALAHALQFDGRKQFRVSGEMMARITAAHLVEQLGRAGFVVMNSRRPLRTHGRRRILQPISVSGLWLAPANVTR